MKKNFLITLVALMLISLPLLAQPEQPHSKEIYNVLPARSLNNLFAGITIPQNSGLADNNWNSGHQDGHNSDSVGLLGPISDKLLFVKQWNPYGYIPVMTCNNANQMIGVSLSTLDFKYRLVVFDENLNILTATETSTYIPGSYGGGYFYLDNQDHAIVMGVTQFICFPTSNVEARTEVYSLEPIWTSGNIVELVTGSLTGNSIYMVMPVLTDGDSFYYWCMLSGKYDSTPSGILSSSAYMAIVKIIPDPAEPGGCITTLIDTVALTNQYINNPLVLDENGAAYCVTNGLDPDGVCNEGYLYSFSFNQQSGKINTRWRAPYDNSGILKPGMGNIGCGTAPTIMDDGNGNKLVAIGDNANPFVNVVVMNCQDGSVVSKIPVFAEMRGACEASLIGVNNRIVVENNFGHVWLPGSSQTVANEPGLTMIQIHPEDLTSPSEIVWDDQRTCCFGMTMLCRESGIIFAFTGDWSGDVSATEGAMYYISAIDSWDGRIIWRIPVGRGHLNCHHYGGIYFDRKGDLYVGTIDYLVTIKNYVETSNVAHIAGEIENYQLHQNYPNPFNPTTRITYNLREHSKVILKIFNITGQEIETLIDGFQTSGEKEIIWTAKNLPNGIYCYRLQAGNFIETKKLILQK